MPFKSKAQRRACYAKDDPDWDCEEFEEGTPDNLPEKKEAGSTPYKQELRAGAHEEREHTSDKGEARTIASEHMAEDPDYYEKLDDAGLMSPSAAAKLAYVIIRNASPDTHPRTIKAASVLTDALLGAGVGGAVGGGIGAYEGNQDYGVRQGMWDRMALGSGYPVDGASNPYTTAPPPVVAALDKVRPSRTGHMLSGAWGKAWPGALIGAGSNVLLQMLLRKLRD